MKRKDQDGEATNGRPTKRVATSDEIRGHFRSGLFDDEVLKSYTSSYAQSKPYKHGVIDSLIQPSLLRAVRDEITTQISFTPKETDIYKIHQSGDLANLDGLDDSSLALLPSLVTLRDSLYSADFRDYLARVTGSGPLSGSKTDMAVNVYTPGCHLLCHDDVIGTRRVSYILYLTDPDKPWQPEWGGALRLYPTETHALADGQPFKVPHHTHTVAIPPAFGQLSFFAVQPGESFHDVEEVYARPADEDDKPDDGGRIRMAISGWYHIPQEGEAGYDPDAEAAAAKKSSLAQLQGDTDRFDKPQQQWREPDETVDEVRAAATTGDPIGGSANNDNDDDDVETDLSEADLTFLLQFLNPRYLVPDTVASLAAAFADDCSLRLAQFLSDRFSAALHAHLAPLDGAPAPNPTPTPDTTTTPDQHQSTWHVATPPHKHRYLYTQSTTGARAPAPAPAAPSTDPLTALHASLFPSSPFRKWLALATGLELGQVASRARRFRRGADYALATRYAAHEPQLECTLGVSPSGDWAGDDAGGYEAYLAGEEDEAQAEPGTGNGHGDSAQTGAGARRSGRGGGGGGGGGADPAVYQAGNDGDDEDGGVLFGSNASWGTLNVVLRDAGTLRFVKYVSASAPGDRWDVVGEWCVEEGSESAGSVGGDGGDSGFEDGDGLEDPDEDEDAEDESAAEDADADAE